MKILAVIPCRQNSARVPNKNLMCMGPDRKPNLVRTIEAAQESSSVDKIAVVSDSKKILQIARDHNCLPLAEPEHLARHGVFIDVIHFARLQVDESFDVFISLAPNVPIRPPGIVDRLADHCRTTGCDMVTAIVPLPTHFHPYQLLHYYGDGRVLEYCLHDTVTLTQHFPPIYANTAAGELFRDAALTAVLKDRRAAYRTLDRQAIICAAHEIVEIDNPEDVAWAEFLLGQQHARV